MLDVLRYRFCDLTVQSAMPLPELHTVNNTEMGCNFQVLAHRSQEPHSCQWFHQWFSPDGEVWLALGRFETAYLLRFPGLADFLVLQDGKSIQCWPCPDTPAATIRHLLLDQVMPLLLSWLGRLVLHASAVSTPEGAIAFVGKTGSGKSTLASSFSEDRAAVLSDDCLLLQEEHGGLTAIPSYPGVRLWPEVADAMFEEGKPLAEVAHYTEKRRVNGNAGIEFCTLPAALRRVFFLAPLGEADQAAEIRIEPLSSRDAVIELVKYTYLIDVTDRQRLQQDFERLTRVAIQPLFYRLVFPHDFSLLPKVRQMILNGI